MSKRAFKKYIKELDKEDLEEQIMDLYERFEEVKVFYNFVFNPNEEKLVKEAKFKIGKEYFPPNNRRAKKRRSVAQKLIKHFLKLEMEPHSLADVMFYNVEIAQAYAADKDLPAAVVSSWTLFSVIFLSRTFTAFFRLNSIVSV